MLNPGRVPGPEWVRELRESARMYRKRGQLLAARKALGRGPFLGRAVTDNEEFWRWSLAVYEREGMKEALLEMQDRRGFSVNLLLFAIWASEERAALTPQHWASAIAIVEDWSGDVTERLRAARRAMDIEGLGDKLVDQLVDAGLVRAVDAA